MLTLFQYNPANTIYRRIIYHFIDAVLDDEKAKTAITSTAKIRESRFWPKSLSYIMQSQTDVIPHIFNRAVQSCITQRLFGVADNISSRFKTCQDKSIRYVAIQRLQKIVDSARSGDPAIGQRPRGIWYSVSN